jgi:hypothetical protein
MGINAQETASNDVQESNTASMVKTVKTEKELKREKKEAEKVAKILKKQNQLEKSIRDLENNLAKDEKALKKLQDKHLVTSTEMTEVKRKKLELKIAKLEMKMAKDRAKLKKYRKKVH